MKNWQGRIPQDFKQKVDIDQIVQDFEKELGEASKVLPERLAKINAKAVITKILKAKGISHQEIVHFLHVCEVTRYSGCGCCEHRNITQGSK
jgi:hypothetical protein